MQVDIFERWTCIQSKSQVNGNGAAASDEGVLSLIQQVPVQLQRDSAL
jgi:hypothetical protein